MTNRQIKEIVPKAWAVAIKNTVPRAAQKNCKCRNSNLATFTVPSSQHITPRRLAWRLRNRLELGFLRSSSESIRAADRCCCCR